MIVRAEKPITKEQYELVRNRIDRLHEAIMDAEKDFIPCDIFKKTTIQINDIDGWYE